MRKQSSADCCRCSKVFTTCMRSSLPCNTYTQNAVCAMYIFTQTLIGIFYVHGNGNMHIACVSYSRMKSVLLRWTPSLNDCSKLKGQYTDVKSGSSISVGPSLKPHRLSENKILMTLSL